MSNGQDGSKKDSPGTNLPGFDPSAALQAFMPLMNGAAGNSANPLASWMEINKHWTTFLMDRFQQNATLVSRLGTCANPAEVNGIYSEFFQKAMTDYQGEFAEVSKLGQKLIDEAAKSANGASQPDAKVSKPGQKLIDDGAKSASGASQPDAKK